MKNKTTTILSVVAVLVTVLCITGPAAAGPLARPLLQSGAPTVVSYQGQVIVDGSPYNGTGYCKFAIVDADGTTSYWSNDGSSSDGGEPETGVPLTVTDGLFNVLLGDTTLTNMTEPLTAEAFDGTGRYLRVWFSADDSDYLLLAPDRRIAAVPYALQAQEAAYAADATNAANAGLLDGQDGSYYQARVSGACAVGSTVRAINADGTVVCQAGTLNRAVAPTGNFSTTLDFVGHNDRQPSVTIGVDGLPLISYADDDGNPKVAHCNDPACTSATITTLEDIWGSFNYTSMAIGADGLPLIGHAGGDLWVAHCDDVACTSATVESLGDNVSGPHFSLTIGADGLPLISYFDGDDLIVYHCNDIACYSGTRNTVDSAYNVGLYNSVAIGADGLPLISYTDDDGELKVAHCNDPACFSATLGGIPVLSRIYGEYTSLTIGADGLPLISYYEPIDGDLQVAHCADLLCSLDATVTTLDSAGDVGRHTSVTIGADGLGLISYYDATNGNLKVAHCSDPACTSASLITLDSDRDVGQYTSLTIGADGLPLISYYDAFNENLKVFHCGSPLCTPYFRRR